jgi:hypothetical protein
MDDVVDRAFCLYTIDATVMRCNPPHATHEEYLREALLANKATKMA